MGGAKGRTAMACRVRSSNTKSLFIAPPPYLLSKPARARNLRQAFSSREDIYKRRGLLTPAAHLTTDSHSICSSPTSLKGKDAGGRITMYFAMESRMNT